MKKICYLIASISVWINTAYAQNNVNVGYFLEWATPNQVAKADQLYDKAMGVDVNWTDFSTGTAMTEAMLAGDIDIAFSQGMAPFVSAIQQGAPLEYAGAAVVYEANDCFVHNGLGFDLNNTQLLKNKTAAVPFGTMAQFSFQKHMEAMDVDISNMTIVDMDPSAAATALADRNVAVACIFGSTAHKAALEVGKPIFSAEQKKDAGIFALDAITVTEKFSTENPEILTTFLEVTREANAAWEGSNDEISKVADQSQMSLEAARNQMQSFGYPLTVDQEQRLAWYAQQQLRALSPPNGDSSLDLPVSEIVPIGPSLTCSTGACPCAGSNTCSKQCCSTLWPQDLDN